MCQGFEDAQCDLEGPLGVCIFVNLMCFKSIDATQAFLRGSGYLEEIETSRCYALLGRYDDAVTTRAEVDANGTLMEYVDINSHVDVEQASCAYNHFVCSSKLDPSSRWMRPRAPIAS